MALSDLPLNAQTLQNAFGNARITLQNALTMLPGERPEYLVIALSGSYPARKEKRKLLQVPPQLGAQEVSLEAFSEQIEALSKADWLKGVIFRADDLSVGLTTARSLREEVMKLKHSGKHTAFYTPQLDLPTYYLATAAGEIIMPEGGELSVLGLAVQFTFMRDALARYGVSFEKVAIDEYKNAGDNFVRQEMSPEQREQYGALLDSLEATFLNDVAEARGVTPGQVQGWIDEGVTSAEQALDLGMIDRVAYEDEVLGKEHKPLRAGARFLTKKLRPLDTKRVAVVSLSGVIVSGKSRRTPFPLPLIGSLQAGSETLLRAFRTAEADENTAAIVFYVDSGGGSALASDLIWREVVRVRREKPVVAVMGNLAASGGYYVLTHADHVIAAPTTVTGSIGVLASKVVLEDFNEKYGFNPQALSRGRYILAFNSSHSFDEEERALVERSIGEVYERFTGRVAEGRNLSKERVNEIGRGHIWSGRDALDIGLVDELGGIALGVQRAKEIAGLHEDAPTWNVQAPAKMLLPTSEDPSTLMRALATLRRERVLLLEPTRLTY